MPRPEQLPDDLKDLAYRNAMELTHARWDSDVQLLIKALRPHVDKGPEEAGEAKAESALGEPLGKRERLASKEADRGEHATQHAGIEREELVRRAYRRVESHIKQP